MLEWKNLGEIADVTNGERPNTPILEKGEYPYINAGRTNSGWLNVFNSIKGAVTTPSHGEGGIGSVLFQEKDFWCGALCYKIYTHNCVLGKYLFHYLKNNPSLLLDCKNVGGQPYINRKQLEKVPIEVPPIAEQTRIVGILDTFTASIENLKQQIAQRRKQYEHYRDQLLDLEGKEGVEMKSLGEVGDICMCKRIMKEQTSEQGDIPFFKIGTFGGKADAYISRGLFEDYKRKFSYPKKGDILISAAGTIGRSVIFDGEDAYFQDSNIVWIDNNESIITNKYLYYLYQVIDWKTDGGTIKRLYNYNLKSTIVPVPSLPEQQRIVSILDTFEDSITNLEQQLAQRERQYEYYRNKLLTFE